MSSGDNLNKQFSHPHDSVISAGLRFLSELIAWVAGPWAAALWSKWLIVPALVVLVGLPSVFSTPNDKNRVLVPTPGTIRVAIELLLYSVAAIAPWYVWSRTASIVAVGIVVATVIAGAPRIIWLIWGAEIEDESRGHIE